MATNNSTVVEVSSLLELMVLCAALCALAMSNSATAQEWTFEPIISVGAEYDDNANLDIRTDEEVSLSGLLLDVAANAGYSSSTTSFTLQPSALIRKYDESDFDSDDFFLRSKLSHRAQSSIFRLRTFYSQQAVRTAERANTDLEIEDPDDLDDDDTGRVILTGDRNKLRLTPRWDYRLSGTSSIGAAIDYFDVSYDDVVADLLRDYTDTRLNLTYQRQFSDVNTAILTITGRSYDSDGAADDTTGYGLLAGFNHALSEKVEFLAMIGFEDTDQTGFDYDPEVIADLKLTRNLETIRMFARYRRSIVGSGAGSVSVRDSINLNFRRRLNEKISAGLGVRAYSSEAIGDFAADEDRNYVQLQVSLLWYLSRAIVIESEYRYTVNDYGSIVGEQANSNQINVWFRYQPRTTPAL